MKFERCAGVLLHPSSLPGLYGIGDIGPKAWQWIDFLEQAGCSLWQVLPLGPTGYGDSPYQCFSAFAGNPYLVSPEALLEEGLLETEHLADLPDFPAGFVNYGMVIPWKLALLDRAYDRFQTLVEEQIHSEFMEFCHQHAVWLEDFALFMALKDAHGGGSWISWEKPLRDRQTEALDHARGELAEAVNRQRFRQFLFFRQWEALRKKARQKGIRLIGDAPIFVAHDSSDVWSHPELFFLDPNGRPKVVAGVPPDYFSPTGQLWGNPLYRWRVHKASGYQWWIARLRSILNMVDLVRLDHFRGFAGYWQVPGRAKTAEKGRWVRAPGMDFLKVLKQALGDLPIIAEDLGVITPDVVHLREYFNLPGMRVIQFAFIGGPKDIFWPHNYPVHCVVYTGTHDNDTTRGWHERAPESERDLYRRYFNRDGSDVAWDLIRACWTSVGAYTLAPMQDFLDLDNSARMNYPGNPSGNWSWRMDERDMQPALAEMIRELNYLCDRIPERAG